MSPALLLSAVALVLVTALHAPAASAQSANANAHADARPHPARPAFPLLNLPERRASGQRAVDLLGARLPEVAAWYRKSPDEFTNLLLQDRLLKIDQRGRLFVEDELLAPPPATGAATGAVDTATASAPGGLLDGTLAPLDQTFLLHSRLGAKRTVYLNFRGALLSGTAWNSSGTTLTALPFDTDGIPYSFSAAELQRIQYIWQRVAEDFAPFDVNVTTQQPSADLLTRSGSGDEYFGTTALITSRSGVYSCSCGGVAYIGIYDDAGDFYKPALVFYDALSASEKNVAEAISHEVGHNIGLNHDGHSGGGYYGGHGTGATGWAPIMGVGYYKPLVQWSRGEYATATNVQDDLSVIQSNGMPLRADDHGNSAGTASLLAGSSAAGVTTVAAQGVIERSNDSDVFSIATGGGSATFSVLTASRAANLDVLLSVRNAAGTVLASANAVDALNATLTVSLPAGTYYVWVEGSGNGDPLTTGYTRYGSLGQYALTGTVGSASSQAPVAQITSSALRGTAPWTVSFNGSGSVDADGSIVSHAWNFGTGTSASGVSTSHSFNTPGIYSTQLQVTDNSGLTASSSVTVTVDAPVTVLAMRVADIGMGLKLAKNGNGQATAAVTVHDSSGLAVPGAVVNGRWSGIVAKTESITTGGTGAASFASPNTRSRGTFVFTVTSVTLPGYGYDAALNSESSDSITR